MTTEAVLPQALGERVDVHPTVAALRPLIEASDKRIDDERALPPDLVDAMYAAGIFRTGLPCEFGGLELHPLDHEELVFELSRINGSVGWIASINNHGAWLLAPEVMEEIHSAGRWLLAGSFGRIGSAKEVEGGYRITGKWNFASGAPWATYLLAGAAVIDKRGEPAQDPSGVGPVFIAAILPKERFNYTDGWDSLGLRGTGSGSFDATDLFVEDRFVWSGTPETYMDRPLYRRYAGLSAPVSLGCAQGMIDAVIKLAHRPSDKASWGDRHGRLGRQQLHTVAIAHADGLLRAARGWSVDVIRRTYEAAHLMPGEADARDDYALEIERTQCDTYCARIAQEIATTMHSIAGADAVIKGRGVERHFRDIFTATQHSLTLPETYEPIGQYYVSRDLPGGPFMDLEHSALPVPPSNG